MNTVDELFRAALELSPDDRALLAVHLLDSLEWIPEHEAQALWAAEIERREAEALAGESTSRDWREVLDELGQRLHR